MYVVCLNGIPLATKVEVGCDINWLSRLSPDIPMHPPRLKCLSLAANNLTPTDDVHSIHPVIGFPNRPAEKLVSPFFIIASRNESVAWLADWLTSYVPAAGNGIHTRLICHMPDKDWGERGRDNIGDTVFDNSYKSINGELVHLTD